MISYDLATKLKDAGFPFRKIKVGDCIPKNSGMVLDLLGVPYNYIDFNPKGDEMLGAQHFYGPTLSELIEACGNEFLELSKSVNNEWIASSEEDGNMPVGIHGDTPEEAVANLYLALNKK